MISNMKMETEDYKFKLSELKQQYKNLENEYISEIQ